MIDPENSVQRFRILAQKLSQRSDNPIPGILAEVLGVEANSDNFYESFVDFIKLAKFVRIQIDELKGQAGYDNYVRIIDSIIGVLVKLDMRESWTSYVAAFDTRGLAQLEIGEQMLASGIRAKPPTKEMLDGLLRDIRESIDEVLEADLEADVKQLLLEALRVVERALLAYDVSGLPGLRAAIERTIGIGHAHFDRFDKSREPDVVNRAFAKIGSVITTLRNIDFVLQLPEKVEKLMSLLPKNPVE
jgi:hypothetical protein